MWSTATWTNQGDFVCTLPRGCRPAPSVDVSWLPVGNSFGVRRTVIPPTSIDRRSSSAAGPVPIPGRRSGPACAPRGAPRLIQEREAARCRRKSCRNVACHARTVPRIAAFRHAREAGEFVAREGRGGKGRSRTGSRGAARVSGAGFPAGWAAVAVVSHPDRLRGRRIGFPPDRIQTNRIPRPPLPGERPVWKIREKGTDRHPEREPRI